MNRYDVKSSLLRALNQAHPELRFDLQPDDVSFGKPELFLQNLCNSRIKITALDSSIHFKNQGQFFYNRRRLDQYLKGIRVPGKPSDYSNTQQVVQALVDQYHLPLVPLEFTFASITGSTVELKPLDTCVGFFTNFTASLKFMNS